MIYTSSWLAVIIAAVGSFAIGFLWFGPLFGKYWMGLMKFTQEDLEEGKRKGMAKPMTLSAISSLVTAFIFLSLASSLLIASVAGALTLAFWLWLGFSVPIFLNNVLWDGKPWALFWLSSTHILATILFSALVYSWLVV